MATSQSSGYRVEKLIDGKGLDGIWSNENSCGAADGGGATEWFSLELALSAQVTRVQIANRLDCCLDRGQNIRISIGPSNVYDPSEPLCLPQIPSLSNQPGLQDYVCTDLHEGKFVKISRTGILNLCEVKVFTVPPGKRDENRS